jgi:hypothetical protein
MGLASTTLNQLKSRRREMKLTLTRDMQIFVGCMLINPNALQVPGQTAFTVDPSDARTLVSLKRWFLEKVCVKTERDPETGDLQKWHCGKEAKIIGLKNEGVMLVDKMLKHYEKVGRIAQNVEAYEMLCAVCREKPMAFDDLSDDTAGDPTTDPTETPKESK